MSQPDIILEADDVVVRFPGPGAGPLGLRRRSVQAVNGVSLQVRRGETIGIVGESGSGKSTLGRALLGLEPISGGHVLLDGLAVSDGRRADLKALRRRTAMVFQDPANSLNPRLTVGETLAEVLRVHGKAPRGGTDPRVAELLAMVGLDPALASRRPAALSGGQCQRVGIARALAVEPSLVIADECVAALDVSIQGQVINLFLDLKERIGLTLIFIAHDLAVVRRLCDRVAVMYLGRIVEEGPTESVFRAPRHPYTAALIASIPEIDPNIALPLAPMGGEPPSPLDPPPGCPFHPRCTYAEDRCRTGPAPALRRADDHGWACILEPGTLPAPVREPPTSPPPTTREAFPCPDPA
ncbi:peptide/nickel transport system ATP-binding protein [Aureimonas phyllosphaerae]|uniref:Glutathione import ATP-binding protein GsiA n=1 Tax=Aureimonas phyllosphaerae TaxID=1166078 RepID=A0A7W6BVE0_9HYPH|nr:peptide/nickel transport system ATP-binding protein [Aureimonas phyllosphaerae]MBB3961588.1 peptide/nickel transport system ATP-binding protein [Aureimonas phyllosphaerae]SFF46822.1 peptide/nickel transport system ATP-binding protein [Aureimonas phyllosphaerae]